MKKKADPQKLEQLISSALKKVGVPLNDALLTAKILIDADLRGIDTHGVMNLYNYYVKKVKDGIINNKPDIKVNQGSPTTATMDGDNGLGFIVSYKAMEHAIKMAKEYGSGWVNVFNSNHCGAGAYYVMMAAKEDMIGIHFSSGGTSVAGPGGKGRLIGNNVIAFAAPAKKYAPFVFDIAPTMSIANKAHMLVWDNKKMPEGYVIDSKGQPVTDPMGYFEPDSAVLPLGSTLTHGIHKGFGLLLMSDILTGVLSGDGGSMIRKKGVDTHAFCALKIDAFLPSSQFKELMDAVIEKIHSSPVLDGAERMRYPGERGDITYKERSTNGIPLHGIIVERLQKMCKELNLSLDEIWINK